MFCGYKKISEFLNFSRATTPAAKCINNITGVIYLNYTRVI